MVCIWVVFFVVVGSVFVVFVVRLPLLVRFSCIWAALEMALGLGLGFAGFLGGKGCVSFGGARPPGEGMAALCLVSLAGVRGS